MDLAGVNLSVQVNHCKTPDCADFGTPSRTEPGETGPYKDRDMNYKVLSTAKGQTPSIKWKSCGLNPPMKSNASRAVDGARLPSPKGCYSILAYIRARCREHSGRVDRAFIDGRARLPGDMSIETDLQEYTLKWASRLVRRNVVPSAHCTADAETPFHSGLHTNFDESADPFSVNAEAARAGDRTMRCYATDAGLRKRKLLGNIAAP